MKLRKIAKAIYELPANAFTGITNLIFGSTVKETGRDGVERVKKGLDGKPVTTPGLVGYLADGIKFVSRSTADFLSNHKQAIAAAAWISLLAAGAVALTLFLWPAALAAVATFSIGGLSIAAIAGASTVAQIGLAAGLAAAAASVATYVTAAAVNGIKWIAECCKGLRAGSKKGSTIQRVDFDLENDSSELGKGLGTGSPYSTMIPQTKETDKRSSTVVTLKRSEEEVPHHSSPLSTKAPVKTGEFVEDRQLNLSQSV
ncbi:TPA: hypothetical protein ACTXXA_001066 [Legionella anisa]